MCVSCKEAIHKHDSEKAFNFYSARAQAEIQYAVVLQRRKTLSHTEDQYYTPAASNHQEKCLRKGNEM